MAQLNIPLYRYPLRARIHEVEKWGLGTQFMATSVEGYGLGFFMLFEKWISELNASISDIWGR